QPWVVHFRRPCCIRDWRTWNELRGQNDPPINDVLSKEAETAFNFAVVPMILTVYGRGGIRNEEVVGTIHVERSDGLPPSDDDVGDLLEFGHQMAAVAHQAERVGALLDALHSDQDAVVVFDREGGVRFANRTAAKRFHIPEGWHEPYEKVSLSDTDFELMASVAEVITTGKSHAQHDTSSPSISTIKEAVFCSPVHDWRKDALYSDVESPAIGAVLQIHDLTGLHRVFGALQKVAREATDRESTITALLECVNEMGYKRARLYLVDPRCPEVLKSARALGHSTQESQEFADGHFSIHRTDSNRGDAWECLESGEPRVSQWNPSLDKAAHEKTCRGVTVYNLTKPTFHQSWKRPGDIWIDLPLQAAEQAIGKLTIEIGSNFNCQLEPEEFELLKLFSVLLGALLAALDKQQWVREAADRAMADTAHKIGTKLAGLSGFADDYRNAAPGNSQVEEINQWMEPTVRACFTQLKQVREAFTGNMGLKRTVSQIRTLLESTLEGILGREHRGGDAFWEIRCPEALLFRLDEEHFRSALEAMLDNSRAMTPPNRKLRVELTAESFVRENKMWLRLEVRDNGAGIIASQRERIFEPFYSIRPDGKRSTGLGLSLVQRIFAAHGGTIAAVEPSNGTGAQFMIEIPDNT
ncbi:MAG: histidine kinase, partial [Verrucomicrobiales bacterium]|nr:histidine kinase [Verrucomicrobiales bacterium]